MDAAKSKRCPICGETDCAWQKVRDQTWSDYRKRMERQQKRKTVREMTKGEE